MDMARVVDPDGRLLGVQSFSTTRAGYRVLLAWMLDHSKLLRVAVESTGIVARSR
jgi:hypothetical protein